MIYNFFCIILLSFSSLLLSKQYTIEELKHAIESDNLTLLSSLTKEKIYNINECDKYKRTVLHYACQKTNNLLLVSSLLEWNADVNVIDQDGNTPLHYACNHQTLHTEIIRKLCTKKTIRQKNLCNETPLTITENFTTDSWRTAEFAEWNYEYFKWFLENTEPLNH